MIETVVIVEAPIDALSLAISDLRAIALCGATPRPSRALAYDDVVIATNADAAGNVAATDLARWLNVGRDSTHFIIPTGLKDVNALLVYDSRTLLTIVREVRYQKN